MVGVDKSDQFTTYYSCPRKSIRWYTKVIFFLIDITVVNSFILHKEITKLKITLLSFWEAIIKGLLRISLDIKDGRKLIKRGPINNPCLKSLLVAPRCFTTEFRRISLPSGYKRKSYFLRCRQCSKN